jgi:ABC-2 type transport system permease protein
VIPPDFAARLRGRGAAAVQVIVDASDPQVAVSAMNAATALGLARSVEVLSRGRPPEGLDVRVRAWYNPDQESALYIVPGLIGALLMQTTITVMAVAVVRERERGTLEALIVSPLRRWEIMLGKILPNLLVAYGQMTLALVVAHTIFGVPIRGSVVLLYAVSAIFMMGTLGIGIYVSTLSRTVPQAMQLGFLAILPSIYLSGLLFPIEGMPRPAQLLAGVLPITYFLRVIRGIVLKGTGLEVLWPDVWPLVIFGVAIFSLAVLRFRKSLD